MTLRKVHIAYTEDSATLFALIADMPWAVYLDSGRPQSQYGRYDIITAYPFCTLSTEDGKTTIKVNGQETSSRDDPFVLLNKLLAPYAHAGGELPFCGGAIGFFAYDLARGIEPSLNAYQPKDKLPQMMVGIYDWALVVDHKARQAYLVSYMLHRDTEKMWHRLCALFSEGLTQVSKQPASNAMPFRVLSEVGSNLSAQAYAQAFDKVKRYIQEGDCYQVNLAQRFSVRAEGSGWQAYQHLRTISPAPFMAYMHYPDIEVLSASPERFLQTKGSHVETRPIKGTRPRSANPIEDQQNAMELESSQKDRAENLMIVDLLRNDISKNCETGSVKVNKLFALESFANVHHLVSTIVGELATDKTSLDLLKGCFPGGSITGAPKLRSMQIIAELEQHQRGVYCGAIGYIGYDGNMDTSIAIRTAVYADGEFRFWAGGGIVADSEMEKEYKETWDKASSMLKLVRDFTIK